MTHQLFKMPEFAWKGFACLGVLLALLGGGVEAYAQEAQLSAAKHPAQLIHDHWGRAEGLPQNTVNALAQTNEGYLWIGTEEGLARFNGHEFVVFNHTNTPAFREGASIKALAVDAAGVLWIGTRAGLVRHEQGAFSRATGDNAGAALQVSALLATRDGLLVGTSNNGLFRVQGAVVQAVTHADLPAKASVTALYADRAGTVWVGTPKGAVRIARQGISRVSSLDGAFVLSFVEVPGEGMWVGTRGGIWRVGPGGVDRPFAEAASLVGFALRRDAAGALWVGTDGEGVARVHASKVDRFSTADGLHHDRVMCLFADREGSLWIGTEGGGLSRMRDGPFTVLTTREGLASDMVMTVSEDAAGALWVGTEGGGVTRFAPEGTATTYRAADGLGSDVVLSVMADADGQVWAGTYGGGLSRFTGARFEPMSARVGLPSEAVFAMHRGASGALWVGTDAGVARVGGEHAEGALQRSLSGDMVSTVLEDSRGRVWVGTVQHGLNLIEGGRVTRFGTHNGLTADIVTALFEAPDGAIWVGTYGGGLNRIADGQVRSVTMREGLWSDNIYSVIADNRGHLWMTSNRGVFRVPLAALTQAATTEGGKVAPVVFGVADGLRSEEMNGGVSPAAWKTRDGMLWFASSHGLVGVRPEHADRPSVAPPVVIERVRADDEVLDHRSGGWLAPGTRKIDFAFAAVTFITPEHITYAYRLDGYDDRWHETSDRTATYTNLGPGTYTFRLRARTRDGVWSETAATYTFEQAPFIYERPAFWTSVILALALAGFALYRFRLRQLRERQRELESVVEARTHDLQEANRQIQGQASRLEELDRFKTRFFANISHEFRTPLTLMLGPLENALGGLHGSVAPVVEGQMRIMHRNALRMLRLINQLLDLSKLESGKMELITSSRDLISFLEGVVLSFSSYASQKNIALRLDTEMPVEPLHFEPDKLEKVFFNLLSNAVKFTPEGGAITVTVSRGAATPDAPEGQVVVRVRDTGPGIAADQQPYVFDRFHQVDDRNMRQYEGTGIGLALVRELVLLHGGDVAVESIPGEGAEFIVTLPRGAAHLRPEQISEHGPDDERSLTVGGAFTELASADFNDLVRATGSDAAPARMASAPEGAPVVLVVDDNADIREYVAACLASRYRIATAGDGEEGLALAKQIHPDLILSDIMMPRMDGHAFTQALKGDPALRHIPVILLSAKASQETLLESLEKGADEYLTKPFNARELEVRIQNLITLRAQERELKGLNEHLAQKVEEQLAIILRERASYEAQLIEEKQRAEEAARLKASILNNMSHEFRTPMTAILGYTEILHMELEGEMKEFAQYAYDNGRRLMDTLSAVIDLSRLEASTFELAEAEVDVCAEAREALRAVSGAASAKGLALEEVGLDVVHTAHVDRQAVRRVLDILLSNAVKFTRQGGVRVEAVPTAETIVLHVHDTGTGIGPEFLPYLFDAFEQESDGDAREHEGSGLSLSIAKRLVALLGGTLEVESEKGKGSTFTFAVPVRAASDIQGDGSLHQPVALQATPWTS